MALPTLKVQTSFRVFASNVRGLKEADMSKISDSSKPVEAFTHDLGSIGYKTAAAEMRLTQRIPLQLFNEYTYELAENSVVLTWNSWATSGKIEYPYGMIKQVSFTKSTEPAFRNWAFGCVYLCLVATLAKYIVSTQVGTLLFVGFLALAGIFGLLSLWKLYDLDVFRDKHGNDLFSIRATGQQESDFVNELKSKLTLK